MQHPNPLRTYLDEIHVASRRPLGNKKTLLEEARRTSNPSKELIDGYLEVTALTALHVAPPSMDPLTAIQEANIVLINLLKDPNVEDPVLVMADRIKRVLDP